MEKIKLHSRNFDRLRVSCLRFGPLKAQGCIGFDLLRVFLIFNVIFRLILICAGRIYINAAPDLAGWSGLYSADDRRRMMGFHEIEM